MPKIKCNCKEAAKRLAEMGLSVAEIAKIFGVSERTARRWLSGAAPAKARTEPKALSSISSVLNNEWVKLLRGKS